MNPIRKTWCRLGSEIGILFRTTSDFNTKTLRRTNTSILKHCCICPENCVKLTNVVQSNFESNLNCLLAYMSAKSFDDIRAAGYL